MQVFRNENAERQSRPHASAIDLVGLVLGMILMFLMIYGAMVMQSVIEEKTTRLLEVVVSSISPSADAGQILGTFRRRWCRCSSGGVQ